MIDQFIEIKETKNIIDKLKKVCSMMAKFNLNSPCLLQFVKINGNIEIILSFDPKNGDHFNYYKIFNIVTYDNFVISDDDKKYFIDPDERVSIPLIISTFPIAENNKETNLNPLVFYANKQYCYSLDSFYVFPKLVLEAIKNNIITGFESMQVGYEGNIHTMHFNIKMQDNPRFRHVLFIHNQPRLENIFRLSIFPLHEPSLLKDLYMKLYLNTANSKLVFNPEQWKADCAKYKDYNAFKVRGFNDHDFLIYHNDFFQSKIVYGHSAKYYESKDGLSNIVSLYFVMGYSGGVHVYMKYRYYEM